MSIATRKYTAQATSSGMKSNVTAAADSTDLTGIIDVAVFVSKTATNKRDVINTLHAVIQKIEEETSP